MDLAIEVTRDEQAKWQEGSWDFATASYLAANPRHHVVAMDFGCKHNILRCLTDAGCDVTVVPAETTAETVLAMKPDGVFLSNGPGDPAATAGYAATQIAALIEADMPVFGICIGHQLDGAGHGCRHPQDGSRPPRRQSSGQGPRHRAGSRSPARTTVSWWIPTRFPKRWK